MSKNKAVVIVGVVAVLAGTWVGASYYAQSKFTTEVKALADKMSGNVGVTVKGLKQEHGFLSSSGQFVISLTDASGDTDLVFDLAANYKASHWIFPGTLTRFNWMLKPAGIAAKDLERMFGDSARIEGAGKIGFDRSFSSSLAMQKLATKEDGVLFEFGPTLGAVSGSKNTFAFDANVARIIARGADDAVDVKQLVFSTTATDLVRGLGEINVSVQAFATKDVIATGLTYKLVSSQSNDRIDVTMAPSVKSVTYSGVTVNDAVLELAFKDLNAKSVETLSATLNDANVANLTAAERSTVQTALRALIYQGFSLGITKIAANAKEGSVDGSLTVELLKSASTQPGDFNLVKSLRSKGQLMLQGNPTLDPQVKGMALMYGAAVETLDGGLKASYEFTDGKVNFNGKSIDLSDELSFAQELIVKFLTEDFLSQAVEQEQAKNIAKLAPDAKDTSTLQSSSSTTQPVDASGVENNPNASTAGSATDKDSVPEAALPTAQNCQDLGECLIASLIAAAYEDIDSIRAAATRIDEMPKPDLGNRVIARKLNAEGLEALKRGENKEASEKFKAALKENPKDVEVAGNLGFALIKISEPDNAVEVLADALVLDPRRSSTWTPLGEALALAGYPDEAVAALWIGYQWSSNREKSQDFYVTQIEKQVNEKPALAKAYERLLLWTQGTKPDFAEMGK